jgi:hypothetical protein
MVAGSVALTGHHHLSVTGILRPSVVAMAGGTSWPGHAPQHPGAFTCCGWTRRGLGLTRVSSTGTSTLTPR